MNSFLTSEQAEATLRGPTIVTIGNFDGVHLGHQALVRRAVELGESLGAPALALTFDPTPAEVLGHGVVPARVESVQRRCVRLREVGATHVVVEPFSRELASRPPAWFATEVLGRRLHAAGVVIGWDFRFGAKRAGDAELLRRVLEVPVVQVGAVVVDELPVSSTRVREALGAGRVELAARLLGRPHELSGVVVHGDHRGRELGFPTANLRVEGAMLPADGVYAVELVDDGGARWGGMANLGERPTFSAGRSVEVHAFGLQHELYGQRVRLRFVARLRGEQSFASAEQLIAQLRRDAEAAASALSVST